jgi:ankyrin repeat protein
MGHEACVRVLLARGADVTLQMKDGSTALRSAETDATKALLRAHGTTE